MGLISIAVLVECSLVYCNKIELFRVVRVGDEESTRSLDRGGHFGRPRKDKGSRAGTVGRHTTLGMDVIDTVP